MQDLLTQPQLQTVYHRALRRLGRTGNPEDSGEVDQEFLDVLAREMCADRRVPDGLRREVLRELVGPTPGGLQALAWLCRNQPMEPGVAMNFVAGLNAGDPTPDALAPREAVEALESLMRAMETSRSGRLEVVTRLLASPLFSETGRSAGLKRVVSGPWLTPGDRRTLVEWALGLDVVDEIAASFSHSIPQAPVSLARTALPCLVDQGEDLAGVVRSVVANATSWEDPRPLLQGLLDLIESNGAELQPALRRQALDLCRRHKEALLRRRAYQLAADTEGPDFLREALRDRDFGVRSWALSRLNRSNTQD